MGNSQSDHNASPSPEPLEPPEQPVRYCVRKTSATSRQHRGTSSNTTSFTQPQQRKMQTRTIPASQIQHNSRPARTTLATATQQNIQTSIFSGKRTTAQATSQKLSYNSFQSQVKLETGQPAFQKVKHSVNNYVIPAVESEERIDPRDITPRHDKRLIMQLLRVCPQYNGQGCVAEPCRRLHVCLYWATKTCNRPSCKYDHFFDTEHNTRLIRAFAGRQNFKPRDISAILDDTLGTLVRQEEQQICLFSVLRKCFKDPCTRVHSTKNYLWEVKDCNGWIQMSYNQSDYLELMYSHPSEECVDLIPLQAHIGNNKKLRRLASLISKENSWSVDLEAFRIKGTSSIHDIRRLSTTSDLTSRVPVTTRWLWYWQDDDGCWETYGEGADKKYYYVALSDHLEYLLRVCNRRFVTIDIGNYCYCIDGKKMTQTNTTTGTTRRIRRRPACSLVRRKSVKFDELFFTLPMARKFLKLPVVPLSSEFLFVENLMKQTLAGLKIVSIYRVQNDHLWKIYQNKKRLLLSLYNGDVTAINEQYLFHGTSFDVVDHICEENLDWKLWGTNVGHSYGQGTYFSNLAWMAHQYGKSDRTGKKVMLVVLVLVGKMTLGSGNMNFPPVNESAERSYDTTCNNDTDASIFVKYNRDEYYPAYVVRYGYDL